MSATDEAHPHLSCMSHEQQCNLANVECANLHVLTASEPQSCMTHQLLVGVTLWLSFSRGVHAGVFGFRQQLLELSWDQAPPSSPSPIPPFTCWRPGRLWQVTSQNQMHPTCPACAGACLCAAAQRNLGQRNCMQGHSQRVSDAPGQATLV